MFYSVYIGLIKLVLVVYGRHRESEHEGFLFSQDRCLERGFWSAGLGSMATANLTE